MATPTNLHAATEHITGLIYGWFGGFVVIAIVQIAIRAKTESKRGKRLVDVAGMVVLLLWTILKVRHFLAS